MKADSFYIHKLKQEYAKRQRTNQHYSFRAFSRFLDLAPAVLSLVLKGQRELPLKYAQHIANRLNLSPVETNHFINSIKTKKVIPWSAKDYTLLDEERDFQVISEWEHYALLSLID